ncbi:unnamed protein product [Bursaphelenchus okinawaensis]|uniref:RING-type domain-containing protein n=1 Tax=Bursaphelenchus okinawaensis TaxID=465554 RepID=A0A811K2A1_9BILA|nr:unnamed protein product [Bursaphelenchus okinawaensis]CAG9090590.1 unnamed protein product [Bursaphelenchus okinawaensis]
MKACPKCKSNQYTNRALVMMINECGHPLCQNCVDNIFARTANRCPYDGCERVLKKNSFWVQVFDDPRIEKENFIRKKVTKVYNFMEDNFDTLQEYNDYLEHVEELVWKLVHGEDVQAVEDEIAEFKDKNIDQIERNKRRLNPDDQWIKEVLDEEAKAAALKQTDPANDLNSILEEINSKPRSIISELRDSDLPAEMILDRERKVQIEAELAEKEERERKKKEKSSRRRVTDTASFGVIRVAGAAYVHELPQLPINGPAVPLLEDMATIGYLQNVRRPNDASLAGGFRSELACARALFELRWDFNLVG